MNGTNGAISEAVATPQRLLTLPEAARYLGCKLWSVRELIWKGQIPYTRIGRRFQVDVRDLDDLVEREKRCEGAGDTSRVCAGTTKKFFVTSASGGERHIGLDKEHEQETVGPKRKKLPANVGV